MQDALVDLWLLGECHQLVLSPGSTFGRSAHQVRPTYTGVSDRPPAPAWTPLSCASGHFLSEAL